jgi:hypothetical protein
MNGTLVEGTKSMLAHAHLEKKYWGEAVMTENYLRNRCTTKAVGGKTPHEAFLGFKPDLSMLKTWRCIAYVHIPEERRRKMDPKAQKKQMHHQGFEWQDCTAGGAQRRTLPCTSMG